VVKEVTEGRGADVVYDPVGGGHVRAVTKCIAFEGRILIIGFAGGQIQSAALNHALVKNYSIVGLHWGLYQSKNPQLIKDCHAQLTKMVADGAIRPAGQRAARAGRGARRGGSGWPDGGTGRPGCLRPLTLPGSISSLTAGLPVPQVTILQAERVAALFGLTVRAQPLGSQQDSNFLLADGGSVLGVLKIANPAFSAAEIEAQDAAARAYRGGVPGSAGRDRDARTDHRALGRGPSRWGPSQMGARPWARVLRYLPGGTLAGAGRYLSPRVVAGLGTVAGQVSLALSSFEHPGLDRVLQWDLRHALRVVDAGGCSSRPCRSRPR